MVISRTATGVLAAACVAIGAGGAYLTLSPPAAPTGTPEIVGRVQAAGLDPAGEAVATVARAPEPTAPEPVAAAAPPPAPPRPRPAPPRREAPPEPRVEVAVPESPVATEPAPDPAAPPAAEPVVAWTEPEPDGPVYEELVVGADSVIGLQLDTAVSSERAAVEDVVVARVTRDVRVADRLAIPAGARAYGEVTLVEQGGRLKDRSRLGVRFTSVVLGDGTRLPILTETIFREGDPPGRESATKIGGGAIGGAIIGGILGGAKGAAIGSSVGAGAGTAAVVAGGRNHAILAAGTPLTVRLTDEVVVLVER
jgi:type IV secretory pathway VirB10-like protein